jgi:CRISPR-associated protein Csy2
MGGLSMMTEEQGFVILRHMRVEQANAVAGLTWGFPALSAFLGFTHALSRKLPPEWGLTLTGCAIICHEHQAQAHQPKGWGDYVFALSRNPLGKDGGTASFIEEGRMRMTVSLVLPFTGNLPLHEDEKKDWEEHIQDLVCSQHVAGGTILDVQEVAVLHDLWDDEETRQQEHRRQLRRLLPGFALVQRDDVLAAHLCRLQEEQPESEPVDAWLDFAALKYQAEPDAKDAEKAEWRYVPKPSPGWLVPLAVGYRGISPVYAPGQVARSRDPEIPFRFVETVYSVGEWLSPHRVDRLNTLIWRFQAEPEKGRYLCRNEYKA